MDADRLGTEALIFAVSFFVSLLILGIFQGGCSSYFCSFAGFLTFVLGVGFAFEYDIIYSVKNKEIKIKQREIILIIVGSLGTLQIMGVIGYLIWRGVVVMPLYFLVVVCVVIFASIVFLFARLFEKD
jgi:hypothetical protein